jgi:hypothetical protein
MTVADPSPGTRWDAAYVAKGEAGVSWYQHQPSPSLEALDRGGVTADASVVDVGGGASTLVDSLIGRGHRDVTVLDVSEHGLSLSKTRLEDRGTQVTWICTDLLTWEPGRTFDVWHDRALFHFLTGKAARDPYRVVLAGATHPGSVVVIATFAADGPQRCSGLPVCRYSDDQLINELPPAFMPIATWRQEHQTPWRVIQPFTWVVARRER